MLQNLNDAAPRRGNLSARRRTLFSILIFSARNAIARRRGSYFENGVEEVIEDNMKTALVCGAGGFIGSHLVKRLKKDGFWVRGVDLKFPEYSATHADDFIIADLRSYSECRAVVDRRFDEVYQLAADMGGAGFIFTGENDADIMHNSAVVNLNMIDVCRKRNVKRVFYSSSACIYPEHNQMDPKAPVTREDSAYPANPDSEYGWEKLFSERLYLSYNRNYGMQCRVARYHNIFGPEGTWTGGREKAPAALCRKVAEAKPGGEIEMWGDGVQTRSFLYVDECVEATLRLTRSDDFAGPVNIGSEEMVSINELAAIVMKVGNKQLSIRHIPGPQGVRGRSSHNDLLREKLKWEPKMTLEQGIGLTYPWILAQVEKARPKIGR
jgi:nucleoside-diphosphate-sugar epimerase